MISCERTWKPGSSTPASLDQCQISSDNKQSTKAKIEIQTNSPHILFEKAAFFFPEKTANGRRTRDLCLKGHRGFSSGLRGPTMASWTVVEALGPDHRDHEGRGEDREWSSSTKLGCWVIGIKNKSLGKVSLFPLPIQSPNYWLFAADISPGWGFEDQAGVEVDSYWPLDKVQDFVTIGN